MKELIIVIVVYIVVAVAVEWDFATAMAVLYGVFRFIFAAFWVTYQNMRDEEGE